MKGKIILALILLAGAGVYAYLTGAKRDDTGTIVEAGQLDPFSLQVGDCFNDPSELGDAPDATSEVSSLAAMPCAEPHDNEVYAVFDMDIPTYDSDEGMFNQAFDACQQRFDTFVGVSYEESEFDILALYPTQQSWQQDDREVVCAVFAMSGEQLVGSVAGTAR